MMSSIKRGARSTIAPLAGWLGKRGVHPNTLTLLGLLFAGITAVLLAQGRLRLALIPYTLSGLADMLDGAVARATGRGSAFGAALDSTVDRVAEGVVLGGLLLGLLNAPPGGTVLCVSSILLFLISSFLVSYTRARAEGLGLECTVGWMERPARLVLLAILLLLGRSVLLPGLIILGLLTTWTVIQRMIHISHEVGRLARNEKTRKVAP
ncbi:MAG: CDP-alcohol phosphatidyltransferase family protein [Candidatus Eisenbacteria bacterium]|uniref:CDP-alcohol phosphatidyltransferase family protein n=1 Tax=Eiseniibacteriota bacterium TaxID=2212470 RepID=A0A948RWC2_UNCEI|nr:CDP-alcohol phosphatidyltransferase family protein [Candidatus Eisenbacteria bacterium]MBU1947728.1 CDP-alcohol phosphatidyltransferase family protein [Candidatus Eisenbacteria bacterium]MBU2689464.1 CDP-alcohol phosphatidyltransferase family protein [Candidatus Eisenbacteria bacterium]